MPSTKEQLEQQLAPFGQEHLLTFWDDLSDGQRQALAEQIEKVDFSLIGQLFQDRDHVKDAVSLAERAEPLPAFHLGQGSENVAPAAAIEAGESLLADGKVGAVLVAGGQGTRLGFPQPKGMYPIGPVSDATLFAIHAEKILARARRYGKPIPFCVMTSPATHEETVAFFRDNDRFGLAEDDLHFFCQGTMPAVDMETGRLLLAEPGQLARNPDGHGGMLAALAESGLLGMLQSRGVEQLFYFQVDNPLVDIGSPEFLGYHALAESELTSQVVRKQNPMDRVGNIIRIGDRLHVIEYSDLPDEVAQRRREDGSLLIWAGSIAVHVFDVAFLARMQAKADALPFHIARKKVPYVDAKGRRVTPTDPNAIKFERFIFDLMPSAANAVVVEVDPRRHFAPLKNASGAESDTPEMVREYLVSRDTEWLTAAGAVVTMGTPVEISPLFALDAEETAARIQPGTTIEEPTYFRP